MKGLIRWFAENHVAANLLMIGIVVGGLLNVPNIARVVFPSVSIGFLEVTVPYRGAGPAEIEERILIRIEEAVEDVKGIKRVISRARENVAIVMIDVETNQNFQEVMDDVRNRIATIDTFPPEAEIPRVRKMEFDERVVSIAIAGQADERTLRELGFDLRDEITALRGISKVEVFGARDVELAIEVSEYTLRKYGLSFDDVARAVRTSSINLPAGNVKARGGDIELKTHGQAYTVKDFEDIVVHRADDGTRILVRDVATVKETFQEIPSLSRFNGEPAIFVDVFSTNNSDVIEMSATVREYLATIEGTIPAGLTMTIWQDDSTAFSQRIGMLLWNGLSGLILVFIVLFLFLRPIVAFWVTVGIAVSFIGPFWILPFTFVNINIISTFAFLLVLGIVVDDAIIIGESIHLEQEKGERGREAAILGAQRVSKPIFFAALTTMISFSPMLFFPGDAARIAGAIPVIVILTLMFSLIECLFILPHHLSSMKPMGAPRNKISRRVMKVQGIFANALLRFASEIYRPFVEKCLNARYVTLASFLAAFALAISLLTGGWVRSEFQPDFTMNRITAQLHMSEGVSLEQSRKNLIRLENAARKLAEELAAKAPEIEDGFIHNIHGKIEGSIISAEIELLNFEDIPDEIAVVADRWQELTGPVPEIVEFRMNYTANDGDGFDLAILVTSDNRESLDAGTLAVKEQIDKYSGVYGIYDLQRGGRPEVSLRMKPEAETLSLTLADVARQVRQGFYGEEAQRIPRGRDDVRVMIRYPIEERQSIESLSDMRIRTPDGRAFPFDAVAEASFRQGHAYIRREDGLQTNYVLANLSKDGLSATEILEDLKENYYADWEEQFPGLKFGVRGILEQQADFMAAFQFSFVIAMLTVYTIMAIAFRSYSQPLIILTAVPFGYMGAIIGHLILGLDVSIMSYLGIIAAAGVVINDNLVLVDYINRLRDEGVEFWAAIREGAESRFRPIILTSLTTFVGLLPIMLKQGVQAAFLSQMVVSLAFGVLFATTVTLLLVPALIGIGDDLVHLRHAGFVKTKNFITKRLTDDVAENT